MQYRSLSAPAFVEELRDKGSVEDHPIVQRTRNIPSRKSGKAYVAHEGRNSFVAIKYPDVLLSPQHGTLFHEGGKPDITLAASLVLYPKDTTHADLFERSEVKHLGPQTHHPGSAISLFFVYHPETDSSKLVYTQHSFQKGSPLELTEEVARQYMGQKGLLFDIYLRQIKDLEIRTITLSDEFYPINQPTLREVMRAKHPDLRDRVVGDNAAFLDTKPKKKVLNKSPLFLRV